MGYIRQLAKPYSVLDHWAHKVFIMLFPPPLRSSAHVKAVFPSCQGPLNPGSAEQWRSLFIPKILQVSQMKCFPFACCAFRDHARGRSQSNALFWSYSFVVRAHLGDLKHGRARFPPFPKGHSDVLLWGMPYLPRCPHIGCFWPLLLSWYTCLQPRKTDQCLDKFPRKRKNRVTEY